MKDNQQGFSLIEVMAAMLILALAYVAIMESFSSSMGHMHRLDRHYDRLLEAEESILSLPLYFAGLNDASDQAEGELYLEGQRFSLTLIKQESGAVQSLVMVKNQ